MKTLFLSSDTTFVIKDIIKRLGGNVRNKKLVFITTPAEGEGGEKKWLEDNKLSLENEGFIVTVYTITGKNKEQLKQDLQQFDIIHISGGNTFYFLEKSQQSGFIEVIRELVLKMGKTYIGTSAGSIIAGPNIYPVINLDDAGKAPNLKGYEGFGLVDFVIFPHWGSDKFREGYMNKTMEINYNAKNKIILLTDNQYVHVQDDLYKIIEVK